MIVDQLVRCALVGRLDTNEPMKAVRRVDIRARSQWILGRTRGGRTLHIYQVIQRRFFHRSGCRIEGVNVIPTSNPSGEMKRLTV